MTSVVPEQATYDLSGFSPCAPQRLRPPLLSTCRLSLITVLLTSQRRHGVRFGGAARGEVSGDYGHGREHSDSSGQCHWVTRTEAEEQLLEHSHGGKRNQDPRRDTSREDD